MIQVILDKEILVVGKIIILHKTEYLMVLSLSVRHVVYRLLHVAKRFSPKMAETFCYVKQSIYHVSYAQRKNHQVPIYRRGNESLLFHKTEWLLPKCKCIQAYCTHIPVLYS